MALPLYHSGRCREMDLEELRYIFSKQAHKLTL